MKHKNKAAYSLLVLDLHKLFVDVDSYYVPVLTFLQSIGKQLQTLKSNHLSKNKLKIHKKNANFDYFLISDFQKQSYPKM